MKHCTFAPPNSFTSHSNIMKHISFAFLAVFLILAACKNNPTNTTASTGSLPSDAAALSQKIQEDFYASRAVSHPYDTIYDAHMKLGLEMKQTSSSLGGDTRQQVGTLFQESMKFTQVYYDYRTYTEKLDSLSIYLTNGKMTVEQAQQEYLATKKLVEETAAKFIPVQDAAQGLSKVRGDFEKLFSNANKKAAGN
jgi:hypothetical protein